MLDTVGDAIEPVKAEQGAENVDTVGEERTLSDLSLSSHGDIASHLQDKLADLELIITNLRSVCSTRFCHSTLRVRHYNDPGGLSQT
jgi:hypothetical protein